MDKRFRIQVLLSLVIVTFCMVAILSGRTEAAFWSTLSGVLGYWLPTPSDSFIKRDELKK
jgi:F0F1-type ATP synthase assembly protein I